MCPRGPKHRLPCPVGDRGLQAAQALAQRRPVQAHLRHIHRVQEHRIQDRQRPQALSSGSAWRSGANWCSIPGVADDIAAGTVSVNVGPFIQC